jgi:hypothetical protein
MEAETSGRRFMLPTMRESLFKIRRTESQKKRTNKVLLWVSLAALALGILALGLGLGLRKRSHGRIQEGKRHCSSPERCLLTCAEVHCERKG